MPATTVTTSHLVRWASAELDAIRQRQASERDALRHAACATAMHNHLENLAYYAGQVHALGDLLAAFDDPELPLA